MNEIDFPNLSFLLSLMATLAMLMLAIGIKRHHLTTFLIFNFGLLFTFFATFFIETNKNILDLLSVDNFSLFWIRVFIGTTILISLMIFEEKKDFLYKNDEKYLILVTGLIGAILIVANNNFMAFFLGLELLSISLYVLLAYEYKEKLAIESAIKYLILGSMVSAIILFGIAIIFSQTGSFNLIFLQEGSSQILLLGLMMLVMGMVFKLSLVPLHFWILDVSYGASAASLSFLLLISKGAVLIFLGKILFLLNESIIGEIFLLIKILGIFSVLVGSILALSQTNLKKLMACSSIANMGYAVLIFLTNKDQAFLSISAFLLAYFCSTMLLCLSLSKLQEKELDISNLGNLNTNKPALAWFISLSMLSLMGAPITAGLIAKWTLLQSLVEQDLYGTIFFVVLGSAIGLYAYLRVIIALFAGPSGLGKKENAQSIALDITLILQGILSLALIFFGLWPQILWQLV